MNNTDFWASINKIIFDGFTSQGLKTLDYYAEQFISGRLIYKRFSSNEQYGCSTGGATHVIASILAGAENPTDTSNQKELSDFQRECKCAAKQEKSIEQWAKAAGCWMDNVDDSLPNALGNYIAEGGEAKVYDHGATLIKTIGLDYFIQPILALDRITLHNTYFPETSLKVVGFGRDAANDFKIIVEQPFVEGSHMSDDEIGVFMNDMGFTLINPRNWTYSTPNIYLSDMHDENVLRSSYGAIFVVDCDIRINTPELRANGVRRLITDVDASEIR